MLTFSLAQISTEPTFTTDQKVDIRVIQVLLGHKKLVTMSFYAPVATEILREVVSPLETLHPA